MEMVGASCTLVMSTLAVFAARMGAYNRCQQQKNQPNTFYCIQSLSPIGMLAKITFIFLHKHLDTASFFSLI